MRSVPTRALLFGVAFIAVLLVWPLSGQQPQKGQKQPTPTFRVRIEYVEVDAVVHAKDGRFIADLKKDDFEVLEDGKPQQITNLALVDVPVEPRPATTLVTGRPVEPDVYSNNVEPGRLYLIVIDDLHVHPARTAAARRIARMFIEQNIAPNDLAAVVVTSGNRRMAQDFTNNRRLLLNAVDKVVGRKVISPGLASLSVMGAPDEGASDTADPQRLFNARTTLDTLASLATFAGTIHNHRKTIVLVGEGPDYDLGASEIRVNYAPLPSPGQVDESGGHLGPVNPKAPKGTTLVRRELRDRLRSFIDAANRGNVTLYAFDPAVYTLGGDDLVDIASGLPGDYDATSGLEITKSAKLQDDLMAAQDNLRTMSSETGGFAVTASRSFASAFERIRSDNSHYYILGYYPTNDKRDGKFRKIDVKVKRPGVTVLARRGYMAPKNEKAEAAVVETKEGTSAALREALLSALPTPGLPISVTAAPFRGSQENASVLVMLQTPPGAVKFVEKNGRIEGNLELSFVAIDDQGKTRGGEHLDLTMPLKPETHAAVERAGLLVQSRVALPPGRYVLRVGARDGTSERVGAIHCDLEVPDYAKLPLSMSGLIIASAEAVVADPRPDPELSKLLADPPSVIREFRETDQLSVLAEIYGTNLSTPRDMDIIVTVTDEDGREAYRHEDKRSTAELQGMQGGFGYLLKVPLAGMTPGSYLLRVEARSRPDVNNPVARETSFRVIGK
jgi:VWFA-related protein